MVNGIDNTVSKLRANDGAALGTFAVGQSPSGVAFDRANVCVTNFNDNIVTKLRVRDGAVLGTFAAGQRPNGVAYDGANIWVTNVLSSVNTVTKLRLVTAPGLELLRWAQTPEESPSTGKMAWSQAPAATL